MAEQDIYADKFGNKSLPLDRLKEKMPHNFRSEQDIYDAHFSKPMAKAGEKLPKKLDAEQDVFGSHFRPGAQGPASGSVGTTTVGLLQSAVLPSFTFHAGFSAFAYGVSRYTDRVDGKDWLWPSGITANAWWSAIGSRVVNDGLSFSEAWSTLTYTQKLLLAGVSAWGIRLSYQVVKRSLARGEDDDRYTAAKQEQGFWDRALFTKFLPEAVAQTLISLPLTLPFRAATESAVNSPALPDISSYHSLAVFLFTSGFALETIADAQLESHRAKSTSTVNTRGVWSIVRHPNYLGDFLIHASFPLALLGGGLLHPLAAIGPVANYIFLRYIGGDKENEESQEERYAKADPLKYKQLLEYRQSKNSFWPELIEAENKWTWIIVAIGAAGVVLEQSGRAYFGA